MLRLLAAICLSLPHLAFASPLLNAKSLRCVTGAGTTTEWEAGQPVSKRSDSVLSYEVREIDRSRRSAKVVGKAGSAQVTVIRTATTLSFLERVDNGGIFLTTVYGSAFSGPGTGRFVAVDTSHNPLVGDPLSSQFHGWCEVIK